MGEARWFSQSRQARHVRTLACSAPWREPVPLCAVCAICGSSSSALNRRSRREVWTVDHRPEGGFPVGGRHLPADRFERDLGIIPSTHDNRHEIGGAHAPSHAAVRSLSRRSYAKADPRGPPQQPARRGHLAVHARARVLPGFKPGLIRTWYKCTCKSAPKKLRDLRVSAREPSESWRLRALARTYSFGSRLEPADQAVSGTDQRARRRRTPRAKSSVPSARYCSVFTSGTTSVPGSTISVPLSAKLST